MMNFLKWIQRLLMCFVVFSALGVSGHSVAAEKLKIIFPTTHSTWGIPYYLAVDKGWFKELGLEIEEIPLLGDANAFRSLLGGEGDVVMIGPSTVMLAITKGAKVKIIGAWQPRVDYQLIANKDKAKTINELSGVSFAGAGGISMLNHMFTMILKKYGVDPAHDPIAIGGHSDRLAAVIVGKVDATMVNTLTATKGADQISWITPVANELGNLSYSNLVVLEKDLQDPKKQDKLVKFMKASIKGARYALTHPDEAAEAVHKRVPEMPVDLIKEVVVKLNEIPVWGVNGGIPDEIFEFTIKAYFDYGVIPKLLAPSDVTDKSIVDKAVKELGVYKN